MTEITKEKNKKNWWKILLWILAILACVSIPVILYFTIGQQDNNSTTPGQINLDAEQLSYLADVEKMNSITGAEATTIRNNIQTTITNKMNSLGLTAGTDYTINNLDLIKADIDLNSIINRINASSIAGSEKATGSLHLTFNVREDISNRSISTINVPIDEEEELSALTADSIKRNIRVEVGDVLTEGQNNDEGIDYQIDNINSIMLGAKFADYSNTIFVRPITSSDHLKGTFKVNFQLQ